MKALLFLVAFIIVEDVWNWYVIVKQKRSPHHARRAAFRALILLIFSLYLYAWPLWPWAWLCFHLAFWFWFDVSLNLTRGLAWNYIGQTAWLDNLGRQWPGAFWMTKFILMLAGAGMLYTNFNQL